MRKKFFLLLFLTAAASVCGFFVWKTVFGESDQQIIERRMREVFQMMGKTGSALMNFAPLSAAFAQASFTP